MDTLYFILILILYLAVFSACAVQDENLISGDGTSIKSVTLSADGVPIAYATQGKGEPALLFIHGGFCDLDLWFCLEGIVPPQFHLEQRS